MPQEFPIQEVWHHIKRIDWSRQGFDLNKAYVCALFSELTYRRIPDFEIENADRVNIIPCLAYQRSVREGHIPDFDQIMRSIDIASENFFVVIRRYAIVVGVRISDMIVVAIRGTKYLYDWLVNLRATRHPHQSAAGIVYFHKGFFRAISACWEPVSLELRTLIRASPDPMPIYVTGHSLGGAMAAIMHAVWGMTVSREFVLEGVVDNRVHVHAGYTFGMPRYGDFRAVMPPLRSPYHLYNETDIVPSVPPRWLGFENCYNEFMLDGTAIENLHSRESLKFSRWLSRLFTGRGIKSHSMELYRERLNKSVTTP